MAKVDLGKVGGFVGHYAGELATIATALQTVVGALPLDQQDRDSLNDKLGALVKGAVAAAKGAGAVAQEVRATVKASDVEKAVAAYLAKNPKVIGDAVAAHIAAQAKGK